MINNLVETVAIIFPIFSNSKLSDCWKGNGTALQRPKQIGDQGQQPERRFGEILRGFPRDYDVMHMHSNHVRSICYQIACPYRINPVQTLLNLAT